MKRGKKLLCYVAMGVCIFNKSVMASDEIYLKPVSDGNVIAKEESAESENTDVNKKYLEFAEQYADVEGGIFYSIENMEEGGKPVLLMVLPWENELNCEAAGNDGIYSNMCKVYDYIDGEMVYLGEIFSLSGYLSVYEKEDNYYIATGHNTHSVDFTCIKDNDMYTYGYNTNNIEKDTVQYDEYGEYYDYAYGTTNYDDAINEYSEKGEIVFDNIK